ncbi:c-type cytochrome biogenesis protein CcsB [Pilimelia terevasa]|uniref:C-type cytochrome biogenesis protein CcsB n=1 Tax=Pilimelia terevasa TaxID=53372 RepID=A0A8J3BH39_9ACTN|nr:c-type cytochrome biogenesis protein CcsB [Pilimelia terevasa]GGK21625.1 c-type cytochrome biogenesis protein CcsB [Pilimelia terevasa]
MAALSDQLLVATILAYLAAMIAHATEYAFGHRSVVGRAATRVPQLAAVGGGAPPAPESTPDHPPVPATAGSGGGSAGGGAPAGSGAIPAAQAERWAGHAAVLATVLGALAHLGVLVTRGLAAGRMPWGNMYEFAVAITFVGVVAWLVTLARRPELRHLGLFVALADVLLLGATGMTAYTEAKPLVPALQSAWYLVHVSSIIVASGLLLLGVVPAAMYLIRDGYEAGRRSFPYSLGARVPAAAALERLTFRLHAFAFPLWTFAVAAGAIWAESAWGRYWGWDPKETWAFISWVVYAGYLHARATPYVRRRTAAWIAVIGFATMLFNLYGVNLFFDGLHSYADAD